MQPPEDQAAALMRFTPAEKQVMKEQCESIRMFIYNLNEAIQNGDGLRVGNTWVELNEHMTYLGTMLSIKNGAAIREFIGNERRDG